MLRLSKMRAVFTIEGIDERVQPANNKDVEGEGFCEHV